MNPKIDEKDPQAEATVERWQELKTDRARYESDWQDIAQLIRAGAAGFNQDDPANKSIVKPLSSAPIMARANFTAGLHGTLTNKANRWMGLRSADPELNDHKPMREWLELATNRVLASFRPSVSPFYSAAGPLYSDLASFGNGAQYDELETGEYRIADVTVSLAEVVWDIDHHGRVIEIVRRFKLTGTQAARFFRKDNLPDSVVKAANDGDRTKFTVYQHIKPNEEFRSNGHFWMSGKRWQSRYVIEDGKAFTVRVSGYDEMPFHIARWEVESGMTVGHGPGHIALPSSRVLTRMDDATIRAAQMAADPPKLAPDRNTWPINGVIRPGATIYGGLDMRGNRMIQPVEATRDVRLTLEEKMQKTEEIRDAFHWTLMNLAGRTGMTATEVIEIAEQRDRLIAPHMGRIQDEYLAPKVSRRFSILWRAGQIPPPPTDEKVALEVEYTSAASIAQRSSEGAATNRLLQDLSILATVSPEAAARGADRMDTDGVIEALHAARGAPETVLRSREDADKLSRERAEAQAQAAQMEALTQGAGAVKDLAGAAGALGQGAPA